MNWLADLNSLVTRLRGRKMRLHADDYCLMQEAADTIERQAQKIADLSTACNRADDRVEELTRERDEWKEIADRWRATVGMPADEPAGGLKTAPLSCLVKDCGLPRADGDLSFCAEHREFHNALNRHL